MYNAKHQTTNLVVFLGQAFALYLCLQWQAFDSLSAPAPWNWPSRRKNKGKFPGVSTEGRGMGAAGID